VPQGIKARDLVIAERCRSGPSTSLSRVISRTPFDVEHENAGAFGFRSLSDALRLRPVSRPRAFLLGIPYPANDYRCVRAFPSASQETVMPFLGHRPSAFGFCLPGSVPDPTDLHAANNMQADNSVCTENRGPLHTASTLGGRMRSHSLPLDRGNMGASRRIGTGPRPPAPAVRHLAIRLRFDEYGRRASSIAPRPEPGCPPQVCRRASTPNRPNSPDGGNQPG
jgi:hypothetical protein